MNLHGIASAAIGSINPFIDGTLKISNGYTTSDGGVRMPTYQADQVRPMQIQPLTYRDLQQLDGLNLNGTKRKIFINGKVDGLVRVENKGGDIITFPPGTKYPYGTTWLVVQTLEQWPDWCCVAVTLQNGG